MVGATDTHERLKQYLDTLPADMRAKIALAADEATRSGAADQTLQLLAKLLRPVAASMDDFLDEEEPAAPTVPPLEERLDDFLKPFRSIGSEREHYPGFVSSKVATALWPWLNDRLGPMTKSARKKAEKVGTLAAIDKADVVLLSRYADDLEKHLKSASTNRQSRFQLQSELGSEHAMDELRDAVTAMRMAPKLARIRKVLQPDMTQLKPEMIEQILPLLADVPRQFFRSAIIFIAHHLSVPARVCALAVAGENTDKTARIARGPWAVVIDVVLTNLDMRAACIATATRKGDPASLVANVRAAYLAIQAMSRNLDIETWPDWQDRIIAARKRISGRLSSELNTLAPSLRRIVRTLVGQEKAELDVLDVQELTWLLTLLVAVKPYRSELALADITHRLLQQTEGLLENANQMALSAMRSTSEEHRKRVSDGFDTLMTFSAIVFGDEYAGLLRRSAAAARGMAEQEERKDAAAAS